MGVTNALCEETPHASRRKYPWFSRYTTPVPSGITHVHFLTRLSRVALFDLDDTLIPTEWVRRAFLTLRPSDAEAQKFHEACVKSQQKVFDSWDGCRISPKSFKEDLNLNFIEKSIRTRLRNLAKVDFDQQAASLIEKSCKAFGVVVVVTNARSSVWLHVVSTLFPKLKAQLRRFSIPVIQAAAVANRVTFVNNNDYFQYWANLKRVQFQRVVSATASHLEKIRASLLKNTLSASRSAGLQNCYGPLASVAAATLGSPRTHRRESQELESLLLEWDINPSPVANEHLGRLLRHQLGRSMLYHFAQDHAEIARLPYDLHAVFSNDPFPPTARNTAASVKYEPILGGALAPQRLDIVCVGDSDFELFAARDLAVNVLPNRTIASLGLIKCRTGLGPNAFCSQLFDIEQAIQYMIKCIQQRRNSASGLRVFGPSVVAEYTTSNDKFHTDLLGHRSTAGTVLGSAAAYCWPKSMRCTTAVGRGSWAPAGPWFSEPRTGIKPFQKDKTLDDSNQVWETLSSPYIPPTNAEAPLAAKLITNPSRRRGASLARTRSGTPQTATAPPTSSARALAEYYQGHFGLHIRHDQCVARCQQPQMNKTSSSETSSSAASTLCLPSDTKLWTAQDCIHILSSYPFDPTAFDSAQW